MAQLTIPSPKVTLRAANRKEPRLWIKRFVIWSSKGVVLQDKELRRGLNIVYSPDASALRKQETEDVLRIGHGAGKTLFCRLIRYCLGEETFGDPELEEDVRRVFPDGYVGLELRIDGEDWAVARPLGIRQGNFVGTGIPLEDLIASKSSPTIAALTDKLAGAFVSPAIGGRDLHHDIFWEHLLAWLTRDQECRFSDVLAWRDTKAASKSPALGLTREATVYIIRTLLGVLSQPENRYDKERTNLTKQRDGKNRQIDSLSTEVAGLRRRLQSRPRLRLVNENEPTSEEPADEQKVLAQAARIAELSSKRALAALSDPPELLRLRARAAELDGSISARTKEMQGLARHLEFLRKDLQSERQAESTRSTEATEGRLKSKLCPVCDHRVDEVLAAGCHMAAVGQEESRARLEAERDRLRDRVKRVEDELLVTERNQRELSAALEAATSERAKAGTEIERLEKDVGEQRGTLLQSYSQAQRDVELAEHIHETFASIEKLKRDAESLERELDQVRAKAKESREGPTPVLDGLNDFLASIAGEVLSPKAHAQVKSWSPGINVEITYEGKRRTTAFLSLGTWAFDVATMLLAVEGRTSLPAFLLHDSPREGDLGQSLYGAYFRLLAGLEGGGEEAPFQYIVTTTTEPPRDVRKAPWLVMELDGTKPEGRLLGVAL